MRFEAIFLFLYDVGRSVNLKSLSADLSLQGLDKTIQDPVERRSDTPASLMLPTPYPILMEDRGFENKTEDTVHLERLKYRAKIYEEGVVTLECRAQICTQLEMLHTLRSKQILLDGHATTLESRAYEHFQSLMKKIGKHINQDQYLFDESNQEDYHVYCLLDPIDDLDGFLKEHEDYLAPFLLGEKPSIPLHHSQVQATLKTPFSFTQKDVAIFDMDRAFLIAPDRDYEDLLLIVEHANYQLLELRALDKLLDRLLDDAERDIRGTYRRSFLSRRPLRTTVKHKRMRWSFGSLSQKIGGLQPLRLDALFILENLENSSRIIGDYYLEEIYDHLCGIFNTSGWKRNVERRLEILQSIYTMTKADVTEWTMLLLEIMVVLLIGVEIIALFLPALH